MEAVPGSKRRKKARIEKEKPLARARAAALNKKLKKAKEK